MYITFDNQRPNPAPRRWVGYVIREWLADHITYNEAKQCLIGLGLTEAEAIEAMVWCDG